MALSQPDSNPGDLTVGLSLVVDAKPVIADVWTLEQGLFAFEQARLGDPNHTHFAVYVRNAQGEVKGGVDCHIMWRRVFVKTLWLPSVLRGQGLGTRLMLAVEAESIKRDCLSVWLTALGDRANHFYARLDYRVYGCLENYVGAETLYSLTKILG